MKEDKTNPSHYKDDTIQPIIYIMANDPHGHFAKGNAIKYLSRAGKKRYDGLSMNTSELTDLRKARRYIDLLIKQKTGELDEVIELSKTLFK